ncbi:MAG: hypothetical protein KBS74_01020 [Clostridiales bacterium]|nr:hypothetical protein [Candidatus Cacconaster stercorequi]
MKNSGNATRFKDITGLRSGRLVAVEKIFDKAARRTLWRCKCDCGGEILLEAYKIVNQTIKSCGCLRGPHYKDLTGQRFGMLTAMEKVSDANAGQAVWRCRCDCGKECTVKKTHLENGIVQDCGCVSNKAYDAADLTGKRFGNLTVVERLTEKNYRCVCDCGTEKTILSSSLLSGRTTSCGCMRGKRKRKDISGMRSGMVVAIEPTDVMRRTSILWRCRCDCGKEFLTEAYKISSGIIQSCGCQRGVSNIKDLAGQRFGKLVAIKRLDEKIGSNYAWLCKCDCGKETKVGTHALLSGGTKSCGCTTREIVSERVRNGKGIADFCHFIDGTCVERIESTKKLRSDNTSGYTGVQNDHGKWRAVITFKKKVYYLGTYDSLAQAVQVRKQAEDRVFGEFLEWYYNEYSAETGGYQ